MLDCQNPREKVKIGHCVKLALQMSKIHENYRGSMTFNHRYSLLNYKISSVHFLTNSTWYTQAQVYTKFYLLLISGNHLTATLLFSAKCVTMMSHAKPQCKSLMK